MRRLARAAQQRAAGAVAERDDRGRASRSPALQPGVGSAAGAAREGSPRRARARTAPSRSTPAQRSSGAPAAATAVRTARRSRQGPSRRPVRSAPSRTTGASGTTRHPSRRARAGWRPRARGCRPRARGQRPAFASGTGASASWRAARAGRRIEQEHLAAGARSPRGRDRQPPVAERDGRRRRRVAVEAHDGRRAEARHAATAPVEREHGARVVCRRRRRRSTSARGRDRPRRPSRATRAPVAAGELHGHDARRAERRVDEPVVAQPHDDEPRSRAPRPRGVSVPATIAPPSASRAAPTIDTARPLTPGTSTTRIAAADRHPR